MARKKSKIEPPSDDVKAEAEAFFAHVHHGSRGADPARRAEVNEELEAAIDAVNAKRDRSAKN
jgi:hypothetical protein